MTELLPSAHIEKLGIAEVIQICAKARMVFRTLTTDDVGIDGFIEVLEDGIATGIIAGIQIKSGESFVDEQGLKFRFVSDQQHFAYWARCSFPVIGVVFSPKHNRSVWLDLTALSSDNRILNGPYSIEVEFNEQTSFSATNLASRIAKRITQYSHQRRTLWQIQELIQPTHEKSELVVPRLDVGGDNEKAWHELTEVFLSPSSDEHEVVDAGYRLSWYFPAVEPSLQEYLKRRLARMPDSFLVRLMCVVDKVMENGQDSVADLIVDLVRYMPNATENLETLLQKQRIPGECKEAAVQVIESLSEKERPDLRK